MSITAILAGGKLVGDLVSSFQEEEAKKEFIENKNKSIDKAIGQYIDAKDRTSLMTSNNVNDLTNLSIISKDKQLSSSLIQQSSQLRANEMSQLNSIDQAIAGLVAERPGNYEGKSDLGMIGSAVASAAVSGASIQALIDGMNRDTPDKTPVDTIPDTVIDQTDMNKMSSIEDYESLLSSDKAISNNALDSYFKSLEANY